MSENRKAKKMNANKLVELIRKVDTSATTEVGYSSLSTFEQMAVNGLLNTVAEDLYSFFVIVNEKIEESMYLKKELQYYKDKSLALEIKLKKYLGLWQDAPKPEPSSYVSEIPMGL